jgi:hypothetical protein
LEDSSWKLIQAKGPQDPISANKKLDVVVHTCHPTYVGRVIGRLWFRLAPAYPTGKIQEAKDLGAPVWQEPPIPPKNHTKPNKTKTKNHWNWKTLH